MPQSHGRLSESKRRGHRGGLERGAGGDDAGADVMTHPQLVETHRVGPHTREWIVRVADCPAFAPHHLAHTGIADAAEPYAMVRTDLPGSHFLACFEGEGRIWLDGQMQALLSRIEGPDSASPPAEAPAAPAAAPESDAATSG